MKVAPKTVTAAPRPPRSPPPMLAFLQEGAKSTGWAPKPKVAPNPLVEMPMTKFEAKANRATVRQLVDMRESLRAAYQLAVRDETKAKNRDVIMRFDLVDQRIASLSR